MRKFNLLVLLILAFTGLSTSTALGETVSPYKVDFNKSISTSSHDFKVAAGWGHKVDSYYDDEEYETYYPTYTYSSTAGVGNSGALLIGDQESLGSGWSGGSSVDLLVTPRLRGNVTVYVKKAKSAGKIEFYTVYKSGSSIHTNGKISVTLPTLSTDDYVKVSLPAQKGTYVGIWGSNVYIDDFAADSADVELAKALTIKKVTPVAVNSASTGTEDVDADGNFNVKFKVTLQNTGDVDLKPGDANYSLSIINYDKTVLATQPITQALAAGATLSDVEIATKLDYKTHSKRDRYDVKENISNTSSYGTWLEPVPYTAAILLRDSNSTRVDSTTTQDFGRIKKTVARKYKLQNDGAAPLVITKVGVPEGFATTLAPQTIAAHQSTEFTITALTSVYGIHTGSLTITADGISDCHLPLASTVLDPTKLFVDFEDGKWPTGFIAGDNWKVAQRDYASSDNVYMAMSESVDDTRLITPLLEIAKGEKMSFDVAKASTYSSDSHMNVYYSTDRKNWTLAKAIPNADLLKERAVTSTYSYSKLKNFVLDSIPEGRYYLAFEAGYAGVDNIYGFKLVPVAHDIYFSNVTVPTDGMVNHKTDVKVSLKNLAPSKEEAGAYTLRLLVDGKPVVTATGDSIPPMSSANFTLSYIPHEAGCFKVSAEYQNGDYTVRTADDSITVAGETASADIQVGKVTSTSSNYATPVTGYDRHSLSDVIFTQKVLQAAGLRKGDKIVAVSFKGRNTDGEVKTVLKGWLGNSKEDAYPTDYKCAEPTGGTLKQIVSDTVTIGKKGTINRTEPLVSVSIPDGYVYDGTNLRMVFRSDLTTTYKRTYFEYSDDNLNGYSVASDVSTEWSDAKATSHMPVPYFTVERTAPTLAGTVTDQTTGRPVGNAIVTAYQGTDAEPTVIYKDTTDANGQYSMTIYQSDSAYTLKVTAEDYDTLTVAGVLVSSSLTKDIQLKAVPVTVTVGSDGWTTFSSKRAIDFTKTEGVKAYCVTYYAGNKVMLVEANTAPARTGLLIKAAPGTYELQQSADSVFPTLINFLVAVPDTGYTVKADDFGSAYTLTSEDGVPGFLKAAVGTKVAKGSAYLKVDESKKVAGFMTFFVTTTGVNKIATSQNTLDLSKPFYNVSGQHVTSDYRGVVIQNGRKFVRK